MTVFDKLLNPVIFERNDAGGSQKETYGFEATLLIDLCDAIIKAGATRWHSKRGAP